MGVIGRVVRRAVDEVFWTAFANSVLNHPRVATLIAFVIGLPAFLVSKLADGDPIIVFLVVLAALCGFVIIAEHVLFTLDRMRAREAPNVVPPPAEIPNPPDSGPGVQRVTIKLRTTFGTPIQGAAEPELGWWHVDISYNRANEQEAAVKRNVRVIMRLTRTGYDVRELQMMWSSNTGPLEAVDLNDGKPELVPIAARSTANAFLTGAPGRLPPFEMAAGIVRVTDRNTLEGRGDKILLEPGAHTFQLVLIEDDRRVESPRYLLSVPALDAPTAAFRLERLGDGLVSE